MNKEDKTALKRHGYVSDTISSSDSGKSDFDEYYYALKPPPEVIENCTTIKIYSKYPVTDDINVLNKELKNSFNNLDSGSNLVSKNTQCLSPTSYGTALTTVVRGQNNQSGSALKRSKQKTRTIPTRDEKNKEPQLRSSKVAVEKNEITKSKGYLYDKVGDEYGSHSRMTYANATKNVIKTKNVSHYIPPNNNPLIGYPTTNSEFTPGSHRTKDAVPNCCKVRGDSRKRTEDTNAVESKPNEFISFKFPLKTNLHNPISHSTREGVSVSEVPRSYRVKRTIITPRRTIQEQVNNPVVQTTLIHRNTSSNYSTLILIDNKPKTFLDFLKTWCCCCC